MKGGLLARATACGVTPHAQNTGTSPARNGCASPQSGLLMSLMPSAAGSPMCTGAPWAFGKRALAVTALDSCADGLGAADVGDFDQRTRPRIALAEEQEVVRIVLRQHGEVGLHVALAQSGRHAAELAAADIGANLARMASIDRHGGILPDSHPR